jgi:LmbE family N-acetylglucosaminyl deacetylase
MRTATLLLGLGLLLGCISEASSAQPITTDPFKTDLLLVVAHPDDETAVSGYVARAAFDQHKRIAVVYTVAAGPTREVEARNGLGSFGVHNVWFIGTGGNASQDVLRSLGDGHYGAMLEQLVRVIRLTQPEVMLTWIPALIGDHAEHQAAGVLATEAFNTAGDWGVFPAQLADRRNDADIFKDGLRPWQPKKLYFFTDATTVDLKARGPSYSLRDISAVRGVPYLNLAAAEAAAHMSQADIGPVAVEALRLSKPNELVEAKTNGFALFPDPIRFVRGKSHVGGNLSGDVFEGVARERISFAPPTRAVIVPSARVSIELDGPWGFYRRFWAAQSVDLDESLIPAELGVPPGRLIFMPLHIHNDTDAAVHITVVSRLPSGWKEDSGSGRYEVAPHSLITVQGFAQAPEKSAEQPAALVWELQQAGGIPESVQLNAFLFPWRLPQ